MPSSLFPNNFGMITNAINAIKGGNASQLAEMMARNNPAFARFMADNKGLTPEQIASKYGVDMNAVRDIMKSIK